MTIKAGQNIRFDVKISGEPPPSKSWFLNKARLDSKDDISIDNEDYKTKLVIMPVSRKHSGTYVIKAENSSGKDEVAVEIIILGMLFPFLIPAPAHHWFYYNFYCCCCYIIIVYHHFAVNYLSWINGRKNYFFASVCSVFGIELFFEI
jgi:hypothetical protein